MTLSVTLQYLVGHIRGVVCDRCSMTASILQSLGPALAKTPTGITGLDQITGGGLPRNRTTLVTGGAGSGKTLLALEFLVRGARDLGEPGVLITFEESAAKVAENVASLGFDLPALEQDGLLIVHAFRIDPAEFIETGDFDLEPMFLLLDDSIRRIGAKRVVLDTIEVLLGAFEQASVVRAEIGRLIRWLEERSVTAIVTGESTDERANRFNVEAFVTDCVIVLDHRVRDEISTRRLRIQKYRGSAHGTNEYPFLISARGFSVLPITSVALDYAVSEERISSGVARLDEALAGGVHRGSTVLISGTAGTGKTTLGATFINAACSRGERAIIVHFEESPGQLIRNMRSVGLDLGRWVDGGLLHIWSARPTAYGLESHLANLAQLVETYSPTVVTLDGVGGLGNDAAGHDVSSAIAREIDMLKARGITAVATTAVKGEEATTFEISSLVDTWLLLRNVEAGGERNRLLFILKSRGTAHSNKVREFVLTDHGAELVDVTFGPDGVVVGSERRASTARAARELSDEQ